MKLIRLGNFSQDIPVNSTLKVHGLYENYEPGYTFIVDFCDPEIMYSVDQPGNNKCPPKKGGALVIFEYYTSPWDLGPVSHC